MNKHRGEVKFTAGEREFTLRPTNAALQEIEDQLDMGLIQLAIVMQDNQYRIKHVARVIYETAKAGEGLKDGEDYDAMLEIVMDGGLMTAANSAAIILAKSLQGERKKKAEAAPQLVTG